MKNKIYRVMWQVWDEEKEEYVMEPATPTRHPTKEAAIRERDSLKEDPIYACESFFIDYER